MNTDAPVNVVENVRTDNDALWSNLNQGHQGFWPATIKAFYVYGVVLSIFQSTEILIHNSRVQLLERTFPGNFPRYFTAFSVCASAIELFGRCLGGIVEPDGQSTRCLTIGFNWLANPGAIDEDRNRRIITTTRSEYSARDLINLRNFSAHGQATTPGNQPFLDFNLLDEFPQMMGTAIETWWYEITTTNLLLCNNLANATVLPVHLSQPINQTMITFNLQAAGTPFIQLQFS